MRLPAASLRRSLLSFSFCGSLHNDLWSLLSIVPPRLHPCPVEPFLVQALIHHQVQDTRPPSARANLTNVADVPKYVMPAETYSALPDSVLAWKKANKLGRFDPHAPEIEKKRIDEGWHEVKARGMMGFNR